MRRERFLFIQIVILVILAVSSHNVDYEDTSLALTLATRIYDTAIVAAPDGMLYIVDTDSGNIVGSFSSGPSIYSSYRSLSCSHTFYVDVGDDWNIYVHTRSNKVKLDESADEFVRRTPFISADGGSILGSQSSTNFIVDAKDGKIVSTSDMGSRLTDLKNWKPVYVTRTDYYFRYLSKETGKVMWQLKFAEFEASCLVYRIYPGSAQSDFFFDKSPIDLPRERLVLPSDNLLRQGDVYFGGVDHGKILLALPAATETNIRSSGSSNIWYLCIGGAVVLLIVLTVGFYVKKKHAVAKVGENKVEVNKVEENKARKKKNVKENKARKKKNVKTKNAAEGVKSETEDLNGRWIGKMFVSGKEIAHGSNGTVVYEGTYEDGKVLRPVAVKRLLKTHHSLAEKEIINLMKTDCHPNIARLYGVEQDLNFMYLALERCTSNLYDFIINIRYKIITHQEALELWESEGHPSLILLALMRHIIKGVAHLHEVGLIHRDLKPQNVLVLNEVNPICAKISDLGISKCLPTGMSSVENPTGLGTSGWQAPEQLEGGAQTCAVDLFSLGCLLFFCMTKGEHPFSEDDERIKRDQKDLSKIEFSPEAHDLITRLLDPKAEPKAEEVKEHPLFWDIKKRNSFLRDVGDRIESLDTTSTLYLALEGTSQAVLKGRDWTNVLDNSLVTDMSTYRGYDGHKVCDLLRGIRNVSGHFHKSSAIVKGIIGSVPDGLVQYFSKQFPDLLIEAHKVIRTHCATEDIFKQYL